MKRVLIEQSCPLMDLIPTPVVPVKRRGYTDSGCTCLYYELDGVANDPGKMGLKTYTTERTRDRAQRCQHEFWLVGLAPPVGPKVKVTGNNDHKWGIRTGIAVMPGYGDDRTKWWREVLKELNHKEWKGAFKSWYDIDMAFRRCATLRELHVDKYSFLCDVHTGNLGLWMGAPVLIDFT